MANFYLGNINIGYEVKPTPKQKAIFDKVQQAFDDRRKTVIVESGNVNGQPYYIKEVVDDSFSVYSFNIGDIPTKRKEPLSFARERHYKSGYKVKRNIISYKEEL